MRKEQDARQDCSRVSSASCLVQGSPSHWSVWASTSSKAALLMLSNPCSCTISPINRCNALDNSRSISLERVGGSSVSLLCFKQLPACSVQSLSVREIPTSLNQPPNALECRRSNDQNCTFEAAASGWLDLASRTSQLSGIGPCRMEGRPNC
jgi:hypothetical protein